MDDVRFAPKTVAGTAQNAVVRGLGEKVKIFIGTEPKAEIARKVLECSIRRRTNSEVEFIPMIGPQWEYDTTGIKVGTGFSLRRWMIPAYCGWHGRAIYLDADQLVFSDIWDLWTQPDQKPEDKASVWCSYQTDKYNKHPSPQTSVMVIDCARAKNEWGWRIEEVLAYLKARGTKDAYAAFMHCTETSKTGENRKWWTAASPVQIGVEWNSLNIYAAGKTKLLHYTKEPEQPWYKPDHPLALQWKMELQIAISLGYVSHDEIRDAISKFKIKEDWRSTNGLHPEYASFLKGNKPAKLPDAMKKKK